MEITHAQLPKSRVAYTATIQETEIAEFFAEAASNLAAKTKIAGFRPGKAPADVVRGQLDVEDLREEAYSLAARLAWSKIAETSTVLPIEDPSVEVEIFEEGKDGALVFSFDVRPEIKLGNWQGIKIEKITTESVTDTEVDDVITNLGKAHAKTLVKIDAAASGDKVEVSFVGSIGNVRKDKLTAQKFALVLGSGSVVPGFDDNIIGLKRNDKKTFTLNFPKDHFDKELNGKEVTFDLTVDEVFSVILPAFDKEFADKFGHDSFDELKAAVKEDLISHKQEEVATQRKAKWLADFDTKVTCEVPTSLVKAEVARSRESWSGFLAERNLNPKEWLERRETTIEKMEEDWSRAAESSVRIGLGLSEVAKTLGKELKTDQDYQEMLDSLVDSPK